MPQVIEHAHEDHDVEPLAETPDVVDRELAKLDLELVHLRGETRLPEIFVHRVEAEHALRAASFHLHCVEARIASNVEHRLSCEILWNGIGEMPPLYFRVVTEEVTWGGRHAVQIEIVKPRTE